MSERANEREGEGKGRERERDRLSTTFSSLQLKVCQAMFSEAKRTDLYDMDDDDSPLVVGHNIYILAYKLADHKKELRDALDTAMKLKRHDKHDGDKNYGEAVQYYAKNTAQIEVWWLVM